jgi:hypothetical protein
MTVDHPIDPVEDKFWAYVRGELDEPVFESWLYGATDLDVVFGTEDYLSIVGCDFSNDSARARGERMYKARDIVSRRFPRECACLSVLRSETRGDVPWVAKVYAETLALRTPWIELLRCRCCGTHWLAGNDTIDDVYHLLRLSTEVVANIVTHDRWPTEFNDRASLWPDNKWLNAFGFDSLDAWRAKNDRSQIRAR